MVSIYPLGFWLWDYSKRKLSYKICPCSQCPPLIQFSKYLLRTHFVPGISPRLGIKWDTRQYPWSHRPHCLNSALLVKCGLWASSMSTDRNESLQPLSRPTEQESCNTLLSWFMYTFKFDKHCSRGYRSSQSPLKTDKAWASAVNGLEINQTFPLFSHNLLWKTKKDYMFCCHLHTSADRSQHGKGGGPWRTGCPCPLSTLCSLHTMKT